MDFPEWTQPRRILVFQSDHFEVELKSISETFTGGITARVSDSSLALAPELPLEELVRQAKPAVVYLKGPDKSGSGFFVTGTGVIVTNAHLARGEETLHTLLSTGRELEGKVVYIDADLDIALVKVAPTPAESELLISRSPTLPPFSKARMSSPSGTPAMGCPSASQKAS